MIGRCDKCKHIRDGLRLFLKDWPNPVPMPSRMLIEGEQKWLCGECVRLVTKGTRFENEILPEPTLCGIPIVFR